MFILVMLLATLAGSKLENVAFDFEICITVLQIQVVERESETRTRDLRDSTPALWPLDHAASMLT